MTVKAGDRQIVLFTLLALFMATTRFHHFGSPVNLPDASLAVFFLAGFYLSTLLALPSLLLGAGLIDYLAIHVGGVSDWCASPAYWFLIPTYASLWLGGRWYAKRYRMNGSTLIPLLGALIVTTGIAFVISNASFYLLSGYFSHLNWTDYSATVAKYFPHYMGWTLFYTALAGAIHLAVLAWQPSAPSRAQP